MTPSWLRKFEHNHVFTDDEAWLLFRIAAIGEACGWSLLILGIACEHFVLPGNHIPVLIAGQVHGVLFSLYALSAIGLYPALRWSRPKALIALLASVPPYGSLLFEQWAWHRKRNRQFRAYQCCVLLARLA